jgi:hypothetical protein
MKRPRTWLWVAAVLVTLSTATSFAGTRYVITNDQNYPKNTASIYSVGDDGALTLVTTIATGGAGLSGGAFATPRVNVLRSKVNNCAYVGDALGLSTGGSVGLPGDVAAIDMSTLTLAGTFPGFPLDSGEFLDVGLAEAPSGTFLFAAYTTSSTITTYEQLPGCRLKKLSQVISVGLNPGGMLTSGGPVIGMKVTPNGNFLILAYADASIGSYDINPTTGALTLIGRYFVADAEAAVGVDITSDSKWALFGDSAGNGIPVIEVAAIHDDGSLGPTMDYAGIGLGTLSNNVWLSPDESMIYISNNQSGQITAAPFDKGSGVINIGKTCTSSVLKNFEIGLNFLGSVVTGSTEGTGSPLYVAEYPSSIAIVEVIKADGSKPCKLWETSASPVLDPASTSLLTVGVDPPRSF